MKSISRWFASSTLVIGSALALVFLPVLASTGENQLPIQEAPAGFDNLTNGLTTQAVHDDDRLTFFSEVDTPANGLGSEYNGTSCAGCHSSPVSGGPGLTAEVRAGHYENGVFVSPTVVINDGKDVIPNRSLINTFASCPAAKERIPSTETVVTNRMTVNTLGDGFVEAVDDSTLIAISRMQQQVTGGRIQGQALMVDVLEAPGVQRVGRFGWKDQQASLLSFSGDAYLNEQGITNRFFAEDVTEVCDSPDKTDPEDAIGSDGLADIDHFARFMRATKVPPVDATIASTSAAKAGAELFEEIGCSLCHVTKLKTVPTGTAINGGTFVVPAALGGKVFHPYSDFLLHNIGSGDGIVQNGGQETANKIRTAPLWGLRTHTVYMHDGKSTTVRGAISRHGGEAQGVYSRFRALSSTQQSQILKFLSSL